MQLEHLDFFVTNPLENYLIITYPFGKKYKWGRHIGVDLKTKEDDVFPSGINRPVVCCADGDYLRVGFDPRGGYYVVIDHKNGFISKYFHLSRYIYKDGWKKVKKGSIIGYSGDTGSQKTGAHLHWELWLNGVPVDPLLYLRDKKEIEDILNIAKLLNQKVNDYFTPRK